ncbi:hypothetical protein F5Y15DRAFT_209279 [Xylariaceae sp. FL0016]|nr:hypothetical protein F5Y15DRAFT_209279 [Xylariaceae sp. FL0016]
MPFLHKYSPLPTPTTQGRHLEPMSSSLQRRWVKWRMIGLFILSNLVMFLTGLLASHPLLFPAQGTPCSATSATREHDHIRAASKAKASTMIDGVEVMGTKCGNNWQEAKELGCRFDVMASRWYSPECHDQEVLDGMLSEPRVNWNFTWYEDRNHTKVVPSETVIRGEFDKVYVENLFHIKHCLYLWRKLHHAVLTNKAVDEDILSFEHTTHCTKMIMEWTAPDFERHSVTTAKSATPFCRSSPIGLLSQK